MASGVDKLNKLLGDKAVTEIMINGSQGTFIEKAGIKHKLDVTFSDKDIEDIIEEFYNKQGKPISYYSPYGDICLPDGSRINLIIYPLARCGTAITIRKFSQELKDIEDLIKLDTLTPKMAQFLIACVKGRVNILFSGPTGAGKTTTMEMLSFHIPEQERIVTIEDTAELQLHQDNLVPMETRGPDKDGKGEVTLEDLIKNALRMRPDRIIVGEVRGPEALDMIQAMSTGHRGTLAVIHGNSPQEVTGRLEAMILSSGIKLSMEEIRKVISNTIQVVVQHDRLPDGSRRVTHISEIRGVERGEIIIQDIFVFKRTGKTADGKIKGKFSTVMRMYPRFFSDFQRQDLLDEQVFSDN